MTKDQKRLFLYNNIHFLTQLQEKKNFKLISVMGIRSFQENGSLFISSEDLILYYFL